MATIRVTAKRMKAWLESNTVIKPSTIPDDDNPCYYSRLDGSYIGRVGMEDGFKYFIRKGINLLQNAGNDSNCTSNIGWCEQEQKWYGWSHRFIYGFGIGSMVKKGHCAYVAPDKKSFVADCNLFWQNDNHQETKSVESTNDGVLGVQTTWIYNNKVPNKKLRKTINGIFTAYPDIYGKGEWEAKTLLDGKEMAKDFAESVS